MKSFLRFPFALLLVLIVVVCAGGACSSGIAPPPLGDDGGAPEGSVGGVILDASATIEDFGTVWVSQRSDDVRIVITNEGTESSGELQSEVTGPDQESFVFDTDACKGQPLAASGQCAITMRFAPASLKTKNATLTVHDGLGNSVAVPLQGEGTNPPPIYLLPNPADFGTVVVGSTSPATTF